MVKIGIQKRSAETVVVYCDESSHNAHRYFVVGGVFFGSASADVDQNVNQIEQRLQAVKDKYGIKGAVKWEKVPSQEGKFLEGYKVFLTEFLESKQACFKCLIVDTYEHPLGNQKLWGGDPLVGYLKFYCVFLSDGILSRFKNYFFDIRIDQFQFRPDCDHKLLEQTIVRRFIKKSKPEARFEYATVMPLDHRQHNLLQLADLLVGGIAFVWHGGMQRVSARAITRMKLIELIQAKRKVDLSKPTAWAPNWFNIWLLKPSDK